MPSDHVLDPSRVSAPFHTLGLPVTRTTSGFRVVSEWSSIAESNYFAHPPVPNPSSVSNAQNAMLGQDIMQPGASGQCGLLARSIDSTHVPMCADGETSIRFDNAPLSNAFVNNAQNAMLGQDIMQSGASGQCGLLARPIDSTVPTVDRAVVRTSMLIQAH